jgi:hypothetical protein
MKIFLSIMCISASFFSWVVQALCVYCAQPPLAHFPFFFALCRHFSLSRAQQQQSNVKGKKKTLSIKSNKYKVKSLFCIKYKVKSNKRNALFPTLPTPRNEKTTSPSTRLHRTFPSGEGLTSCLS